MKYLLSLVIFLISACAQLKHGESQPVVKKSVKDGIYYTSCSGAVEVWGNCYDKARITCDKGYEVLLKKEEANGGRREITFQCNN